MCGKTCIDPTTQCCTTDYRVGKQCSNGQFCASDGAACGTGTCPSGTCGPSTGGVSVCYDTATQCCADANQALVGSSFNGGCYAAPFCKLTITYSGVTADIVGESQQQGSLQVGA